MFGFGREKPKRRNFGKYQKEEILARQRNKCRKCGKRFGRVKPHFDHIDGDNSNNRTGNGQALCPNCHDGKSRRQTTSRARKQKQERDDPFGLGNLDFNFGYDQPKPKRKRKRQDADPFGLGDVDFNFGNTKRDPDNPFTW